MRRNADGRIVLHGAYFIDNFGDTVLVATFANWIRELLPSSRILLPGANRQVVDCVKAEGASLVRAPFESDAIVYAGGGYLGEPPRNPHRWAARFVRKHPYLGLAARAAQRPYAIIGVGVGPLTNRVARYLTVAVCNGAAKLAVRDEPSKAYLVDYGVDPDRILVTADTAIALASSDIPSEAHTAASELLDWAKDSTVIGVHLSFTTAQEPKIADVVGELDRFISSRSDVSVVCIIDRQNAWEQLQTGNELRRRHPDRVRVIPYTGAWNLAAVIDQVDLIVTTKLHVGIVAVALGTPVISIPVHPKVPRFYSQIGAVDACHPLRQIVAGQLESMLDEWRKGYRGRLDIPETVLDAAWNNKRILQKFLDEVGVHP